LSRKKGGANRTTLFVFLGLGAAVAAGLALWIAGDVGRAGKEAEAAAKDVPVLPAGPLQFVMSNSNEATYLALDTVRRAESQVTATVLKVGRTTTSIEGGGALVSATATVDCAADRIFDGKVGAFDVEGKLLSATTGFSGKRGRVVEPSDYQVPALCRGEKGRVVPDRHTAQRESQALPDAVAARAEADAKDADAWAWLCAAGARDRWRAKTPADCAHALELRPDDAATRLDRAYIFLKIGRNAEAAADIAKVLAADPKNATALYARSLLTGIQRRGMAGVIASRADRCAALALEHDVANWAARTYQIQMSREFRICEPG
jgi:tetratricopeptide (TPR) repeat protein